jgi:hypothetical protein
VFGLETPKLELDRDKALELSVIEQQVQIKVVVIDLQPLLPGNKGKTCAQLGTDDSPSRALLAASGNARGG